MTNLLKEGEGGEGEKGAGEEGEDVEPKEVTINPPGRMRLTYQPTAAAAQELYQKLSTVPTIVTTTVSKANVMFVSTWRREGMSFHHT